MDVSTKIAMVAALQRGLKKAQTGGDEQDVIGDALEAAEKMGREAGSRETPTSSPTPAPVTSGVNKVPLIQVFGAILRERAYQSVLYPQTEPRSVSSHVLVTQEELREATQVAVKGSAGRPEALREMLQVAACAVACLQENGLYERMYLSELNLKRVLPHPEHSLAEAVIKLAGITPEVAEALERADKHNQWKVSGTDSADNLDNFEGAADAAVILADFLKTMLTMLGVSDVR